MNQHHIHIIFQKLYSVFNLHKNTIGTKRYKRQSTKFILKKMKKKSLKKFANMELF